LEKLKKILKEAEAAGIKAFNERKRELEKQALEEGEEPKEGTFFPQTTELSGFTWITIDPEVCKEIHSLELKNIDTNYDPELDGGGKAFKQEPKLHLRKVSDYTRFHASRAGLHEAAGVLNDNGIDALPKARMD